jgi:hypothetical protein
MASAIQMAAERNPMNLRQSKPGERGFAAVEALTATLFAVTFIGGGLAFTYTFLAHLWIERAAYEASVCLSTSQVQSKCETDLRSTLGNVLKTGSLVRVSLQRSRTSVKTAVVWQTPGGFELRINDERSLPLLGKSGGLL